MKHPIDDPQRIVEEATLEMNKEEVIIGLTKIRQQFGEKGLLRFLINFGREHPDLQTRVRILNRK